MTRCEIRCYMCDKLIGHISVISNDDSAVVRSTEFVSSGEVFPICCPECEEIRLAKIQADLMSAMDELED